VNTKLQWSNGRLNSATTLQNRRRTINIFGFLIFETRAEGTANKAKYFWIFQIPNQKQQVKQTKGRKLKKQIEKQCKCFWYFCVLENRNKSKKQQGKKKAEHGYTKDRQNMICR
jgi:hypothetical protein